MSVSDNVLVIFLRLIFFSVFKKIYIRIILSPLKHVHTSGWQRSWDCWFSKYNWNQEQRFHCQRQAHAAACSTGFSQQTTFEPGFSQFYANYCMYDAIKQSIWTIWFKWFIRSIIWCLWCATYFSPHFRVSAKVHKIKKNL